MKPEFILNAVDVERGLRLDRSDPEDRARIVGLLHILVNALELSFDAGLERDRVLLWLDADVGEGTLFRALSANIPTMLAFEIDTGGQIEDEIEELSRILERYKPNFLLLRVMNAAIDMGQISIPNGARQGTRPTSPIDKHISIYDFASKFGLDIGWDVRKPRGEWLDSMVQSENALRTITIFQDAGLDPKFWIMNLPNVRVVAEALNARVHIDDRTDVMTCFALEPIFWNSFSDQSEELDSLASPVLSATQTIATMPGNVKSIVGAETYAKCLNQYAQSIRSSDEITTAISSLFLSLSAASRGELVSV